jgi:glycosyltransferase involved in cell wall biosynthesis
MKLLAVSTWFPSPPDNGARLRAFHLLRELGRHHDIALLSFSDAGLPSVEQTAPLLEFCRCVDTIPRGAFHRGSLTPRGLLSTVPRAYVQGFSADMQARVRGAISGQHAALALGITAALYFRSIRALPVVFEEAEVAVIRDAAASESRAVPRLRRSLTWFKYSRFVRDLSRRLDRTTVVSDNERALLVGMGCDPRRVAVVPNGVDAGDLSWPAGPRRDRLVYPGALTFPANADAVRWFLGEILPIIHRARPDVDVWVTGDSGGVTAADLPPANRFTLTGRLSDVRPAIAESMICVVPLRIGGGTRVKILQAMALGTPVLSTSKGAEGLDMVPERHLLIGDSPEVFASQALRLLADAGLRSRITADARALVRDRYTWAHSGARLNAVIGEAVSEWKAGST